MKAWELLNNESSVSGVSAATHIRNINMYSVSTDEIKIIGNKEPTISIVNEEYTTIEEVYTVQIVILEDKNDIISVELNIDITAEK